MKNSGRHGGKRIVERFICRSVYCNETYVSMQGMGSALIEYIKARAQKEGKCMVLLSQEEDTVKTIDQKPLL